MDERLQDADVATMEQRARKFSGAFTGTSGTLAAYVLLLIKERRAHLEEIALLKARIDK